MQSSGSSTWSIGALADAAGTTVRALRHYDDEGVLRPTERTPAGHRRYDETAVTRLYEIVAMRHLGLGLPEIRDALDGDDAADGPARLQAVARRQLEALDRQAAAASELRAHVEKLAHPDHEDLLPRSLLEASAMTIRLDRITTRTGDDGTTALARGRRIPKTDARVEALGAVDELNAQLALAGAQTDVGGDTSILHRIQQRLFDLGADLATPSGTHDRPPRVGDEELSWVEGRCAALREQLDPLQSFVLPGGGRYAAHLHAARTACRLAERRVVAIADPTDDHAPRSAVRYLNRLSDLLFLMARTAHRGDEQLWRPLQPPTGHEGATATEDA